MKEDPSLLGEGILENASPCPINDCIGPALKWAFLRAAVLWLHVWITMYFLYSDVGDAYDDRARLWILVPAFSFSVAVGLLCEFKAVKYFVAPWAQQVEGCLLPF